MAVSIKVSGWPFYLRAQSRGARTGRVVSVGGAPRQDGVGGVLYKRGDYIKARPPRCRTTNDRTHASGQNQVVAVIADAEYL